MNMKILGIRLLQIFSLIVLAYILYYQFFLEEQLASTFTSDAKFYARAYGFAMLWIVVIHMYSIYRYFKIKDLEAVQSKQTR